MAPLILGFVLGDLMEQNLRRALSITNGELGILVEKPDFDRPVDQFRGDACRAPADAPARLS